jgi:hypothetical protein
MNQVLHDELRALFDEDQAACTLEDDGGHMERVRQRQSARLKEILDAHGWPGWQLVGRDGANAAWIIAQHADHDVAFQKRCFALLERAVGAGDADPMDLAYLTDRIAVNEGRKQTYGTQFNEHCKPQSIEDEANVDARRRSVGLGPLSEYAKHMWEKYGPAKK